MNDKITPEDIFRMAPGLEEAMTTALEKCGFPHSSKNEVSSNKVTGADILKMCPGLKEAMRDVLEKRRGQNVCSSVTTPTDPHHL